MADIVEFQSEKLPPAAAAAVDKPPPPLAVAVEYDPKRVVGMRRTILLLTLGLAQFMDSLGTSSLYAAIPSLITQLEMSNTQSIWVISAYQLTFGSFLLIVRFYVWIFYCSDTEYIIEREDCGRLPS